MGEDARYRESAFAMGAFLARKGLRLVYGGAHVGLMGTVADGALSAGGSVVGVIPRTLMEREIQHPGVTDLRVVGSMHERKQCMVDLSDAFVALPGGFGTMDELFETLTWIQLGLHAKPVGLLNVLGFYDGLIAFVDQMTRSGFVRPEHAAVLRVDSDPARLLEQMERFEVPGVGKWITPTRTGLPA
jgi:uncharacterized protein (TIGR00730 family)